MKFKIVYISLFITFTLYSCKELSFNSFFNKGTLLARVGENELYLDEIESAFYAGITPADSIDILNSHIDKWIKSTLKIEKAKAQFITETDDIEQMISQYRNSLLTNKYDNYHCSKIDTTISKEQIVEYHNKNKKLFTLASPIVKGKILIYPKSYRAEGKIIKLVNSKKSESINDLRNLVDKHNFKYIEYTDWVYFTQMLKDIPFKESKFDSFLKKHSSYEASDKEYNYIMIIDEYKNSGGYTPLGMIKPVIKTTILNSRKTLMIREMEDTLYQRALNEGYLFIEDNKKDSIDIKIENNKL